IVVPGAVLGDIETAVWSRLYQVALESAAGKLGNCRRDRVVAIGRLDPRDRAILIVRDQECRRDDVEANAHRVRRQRHSPYDGAAPIEDDELVGGVPIREKEIRPRRLKGNAVDVAGLAHVERREIPDRPGSGIEIEQYAG